MAKKPAANKAPQIKQAPAALLKHYAAVLLKAQLLEAPKLKAGDTEAVMRELYTRLGGVCAFAGGIVMHLEVWGKMFIEQGFPELAQAKPLHQAIFIMMIWLEQEARRAEAAERLGEAALRAGVH